MSEMIRQFSQFASMGGDGAYVWSAYGITLAAMLWNIWSAARLHRQNLDRARRSARVERPVSAPKVRQLQ